MPAPAGKVFDMRSWSALRAASWCLLFIGLVALLFVVSGRAAATNDPPPAGGTVNADWTVTDSRVYAGCTITMNANLIVSGGGKLDLNTVTLEMNCPSDGRYGIDVQSGGELILRGSSNITSSSTDYEYTFVVRSGAKLTVTDSEVHECGYAWGTDGETAGPYLLSGSCNMTRSLFTSGYYGVVVRGASPSFTDCRFTFNSFGAGLLYSSSNFTRCDFEYNGNGVNLETCAGAFANCSFVFNSQFGLLAYRSPIAISGCDFAYNTAGNCILMDSNANLTASDIRSSAYGVYASQGSPKVAKCDFFENRHGLYLYRTSAIIDACRIDHSGSYGISAFYGSPSVLRCNITWSGYSAVGGDVYGTGIQAFSSALSLTGGVISNNSNGVESRYSTLSFNGVAFLDNYMGVYGTQTELALRGCNFSQNRQEGAYLTFYCSGYLEGCRFVCETIGAYLNYYAQVELRNCTFTTCRNGLIIEECDAKAVARGCAFDRNGAGARVAASSAKVLGCRFTGNLNLSLVSDASGSEVRDNTFIANIADALTLSSTGGRVVNNTFDSNLANGIYCRGSTTEIDNNTFSSNAGSGIYCFLNKSVPSVHHNLFKGNAIGISLVSGAMGRYWANDLTSNVLVGINLIDSDGEIFCNTIVGQNHGIACNYGSSPDIHDNNISWNQEGGVLCVVNSNATIRHNTIQNNTKFGISVLGSWPKISDNFINGSLDGIKIDDSPGQSTVVISNDRIWNNSRGVAATASNIVIEGCNFTGNWDAGAWMLNCSCRLTRSSFYANADGAYASGGELNAESCDFTLNNDSGIATDGAKAVIDGCYFSHNTAGVLDMGNSTIDVYDGTYLEDLVYALYCGPRSTMEWHVEKAAMAQDSRVWLAGNLTVAYGATLRLVHITLFMALDAPGEHFIQVDNGGHLGIAQNSSVEAGYPDNKFSFRVLAGGNLTFTDSKLTDCGDSWGTAGERGGLLLLSSQVSLRNLKVANCTYGLIANGVRGAFSYLTFAGCSRAVTAIASDLRLENCSIYYSKVNDLELSQNARVVLMNTTFDRGRTSLAGPGNLLEVYWFLSVNVAWQNKVLVQHAQVTLKGTDGNTSLARFTDEKGWLMWMPVLEFRDDGGARDVRNPYNISVRFSNVTTAVELVFEKSLTLYVTLKDNIAPYIEVSSPRPGDLLNFTPVLVNGRVHDFETGLEKLEVSTDGRFWQAAFVHEDEWSFLAELADGNYTLSVRATDAVGNRALASLGFTVKTRITVLEITSPPEGLLTRTAALTVSGLTEAGAKIQINGRSVNVVNGRFVTTLFLSEGNNTILISATDAAGNTATITRSVVLDTMAPYIEVLSPGNGSYVNAHDVYLAGRTEPGARVFLNGVLMVNADGRFGESVPLPEELNTLNLTVMDAAGNVNTTFLTVTVDTLPPALNIAFPRSGWRTPKANVTLNGTTEPFSTVTAGEFIALADENGYFAMNVTLMYGNNTLLVKTTDRAGNTNASTWYVVRTSPVGPGPASPWLVAGILIAVMLVAQNLYLYRRYAGKGPGSPPRPPLTDGPAAAAGQASERTEAEPPAALPVEDPAGEMVPPEALPVAEILPSKGEAVRVEDEAETLEMK